MRGSRLPFSMSESWLARDARPARRARRASGRAACGSAGCGARAWRRRRSPASAGSCSSLHDSERIAILSTEFREHEAPIPAGCWIQTPTSSDRRGPSNVHRRALPSPTSTNPASGLAALRAWVDDIAALTAARRGRVVRRFARRGRPADQAAGRRGQAHPAEPGVAPQQLPRAHRPGRRRPRRGPHLHLLRGRSGCRPDQQLARARRRCAPSCAGSSPAACAAARCTSCRSRWARSAARSRRSASQLTDSAYVAVSLGLMTRVTERRPRPDRGRAALGRRPSTASAAPLVDANGVTPRRRRLAVQRRPSTSSSSRRRGRSGPTAPATAATPSSRRSASRCASPR